MKKIARNDSGGRIPPGQILTDKFPVLTYGPIPAFDSATWDFRLVGLLREERRWTYAEFRALPQSRVVADFHCVTTWSHLDNAWEGVRTLDLIKLVEPMREARHVIIHCDGGYTTNLTIADFLADDVILAHRRNGADLEPGNGFPLRLVVPRLYAWKSAKWVRMIEFSAEDRPGFWEMRGYHNDADPWKEQRFADQSIPRRR
jgi:DMSO/TMAO reductase YedYZ molybdopterin-dependent catalytic subunit